MDRMILWRMICGYCGHECEAEVPVVGKDGLSTDCDHCGAYMISFRLQE